MVNKILNKIKSLGAKLEPEKVKLVIGFVNDDIIADGAKSAIDIFSYILPLSPDEDTLLAVLLYHLGGKDLDINKVQKVFGKEVYDLLFGVKKLESLSYKQGGKESQLEIFRKMILAVAKDLRVVLIVLANRLDRMKCLKKVENDKEKIVNFSNQTLGIYVPVAARFGMYRIKTDLEDLVLKYIDPRAFKKTDRQIQRFIKEKKKAIEDIQGKIQIFLKGRGYNAEVKGRVKSVYSTFNKLKRKNFSSIDELYDVFAIRIILPSQYDENGNEIVDHLYSVLGLVHSEWKPLSRRFKDFIAVPKSNGYRSLHTVVLGLAPDYIDKPVEIQIRTQNMECEAEYGISSHWIYKQYAPDSGGESLRQQVNWLKGLQRINEEFSMGMDLSEIGLDIFKDRIFVLTPKGEVKDLSYGSTPIDFAYAVHTEVGHKCIMAKVNGVAVPLDYSLHNGDVIEIVTRKDGTPKLQWLSIVRTGFAKNKIKAYFSSLNRESNIKEGKRLVNAYLERLSKPKLDQGYSILRNYGRKNLSVLQREHLLEEIGNGSKIASEVIRKIFPYEEMVVPDGGKEAYKKEVPIKRVLKSGESIPLSKQILVGGENDLPIRIASCCKPKFGDKIIAYVTKNAMISIHRMSCEKIDGLNKKKFVFAEWEKSGKKDQKKYRANIKLNVLSRVGLIRDITAVISSLGVLIVDMKMEGGGILRERHNNFFTVEFDDPKKFDLLLDKLENIGGVERVAKI